MGFVRESLLRQTRQNETSILEKIFFKQSMLSKNHTRRYLHIGKIRMCQKDFQCQEH